MPRQSIYLFSLVYPAFLGTFIYGLLATPMRGGVEMGMMLCMIFYFIAQFGEGARYATAQAPTGETAAAPHPYRLRDALADGVEIALMLAFFIAIDGFGAQPDSLAACLKGWLWAPWFIMAIAFALPPAERALTGKVVRLPQGASDELQAKVHRRLCALSIIAVAGSLAGAFGFTGIGLTAVTGALFLYYLGFILFPARGAAESLWSRASQ